MKTEEELAADTQRMLRGEPLDNEIIVRDMELQSMDMIPNEGEK